MNFARGSTAREAGGTTRHGLSIALAVLGLAWVTPAEASTVVLPKTLPAAFAPSTATPAVPLLSTRATLAAGAPAVSRPVRPSEPVTWDLPLAFEPADALAPGDAGFMARGPGYSVFVGSGGALLALPRSSADSATPARGKASVSSRRHAEAGAGAGRELRVVAMRLEGARADAPARLEGELPGRVHRLVGADARQWQTQMRAHGRVVYSEVFPGVDVAYYGRGRELEYDFIVAPGADPAVARLRFDGVRSMRVDAGGDLILETGAGTLVQRRPEAYQRGPDGREPVEAAYALNADGSVGIRLGGYDAERVLVIDPVLSYATFLGGSGLDQCWDIAVDDAGFAYVVGETESARLTGLRIVSTNAFQTNYQGGLFSVAGDAFVAKLAPDATAVEWFTYLGGSDLDAGYALALGDGNEPVVVGFTTSTNFPLSAGAFQSEVAGDTNRYTGRKLMDAFVTRLRADGSGIVSSTLFGGAGEDQAIDVIVAPDQSVLIAGSTSSTDLPVTGTEGVAYSGSRDGFVAALTSDGTGVLSARYLGGSARDSAEGLAFNPAGTLVHVVGLTESTNFPVVGAVQGTNAGAFDVFLAGIRLSDGGTEYATYLGGTLDDYGYRVGVATSGQVWVAGVTFSSDLRVESALAATNSGRSDALLARFSPDGQTLEMSTYFGGVADDSFWDVQVDSAGRVHLVGETLSPMLPGVATNAMFGTNVGGAEILIVRVEADGTPATLFYGGPGDELAYGVTADGAGSTYVVGRVRSVAFPVSSTNVAQTAYGGERTDGFVLKVAYEPTLTAELAGEGIRLSWPAPNEGFALESAPAVDFSGAWTAETTAVATGGGRHSVQLPMSATNCVFRLRWTR